MASKMRATMIALMLPIAAALGTACKQKEQNSQCWDARQESRDAIVQGKLDDAQKLLDHARTVCAGQSSDDIRRIEGQLADRRETARAIAKEEAQEQRAHDFPTQQFIRWATEPVEQF